MTYQGDIKIGAVYASHDPRIKRRVTRLRYGCVYYVYHEQGRRPKDGVGMPENLFREYTQAEIPPEEVA